MAKTPKLRGANTPSNGVDDATYSAAKLEEKEMRQDVQKAIDNGISLADSDELEEHEMLCGYTDHDGVLHKTFTVREMTGRDEEAIDQYKNNPSKAINVLLSRVVQSIGTLERKNFTPEGWNSVIRELYTGDQDVILMQVRRDSVGNEIEAKHRCPNCKQKLTTIVDIDELEIVPFKGTTVEDFELVRGFKDKRGVVHKTGKIRLATGLDREILLPIAKKNLSKANTVLLTRLCSFDDGMKVDDDVTSNLVVKDRERLTSIMNDMAFGYNMNVEVTCDQCGEEFVAQFSALNFT